MIKLKELLKRFFESIVSNTLYDVLKFVFTVLVVGAAGSLSIPPAFGRQSHSIRAVNPTGFGQ